MMFVDVQTTIKKASHLLKKSFCFFVFGLGGLITTLCIFPPVLMLARDPSERNLALRKIIQSAFRLFTDFMVFTGVIRIDWRGIDLLKKAEQKIICANHPTLLDVVILIGTVNNANCIVKSSLWKNPFIKGVISKIYIPNSLNPDATLEACRESLDRGECLILFPESTRTVQDRKVHFHRSAAHIALHTGYDILPVHIDVVWPTGIGKQDRLLTCPENGIIEYSLTVRENLFSSSYTSPRSRAARKMTDDLLCTIFAWT